MKENKVRQFIDEMFGEVTVLQNDRDNRIWFVVNEIYEKLGYDSVFALTKKCDDSELGTYTLSRRTSNGGNPNVSIITFDGLMDACGSARGERKEIWKSFRKWINNTVIPNLYKDGMYVDGEEDCSTREELESLIDEATEWKIMRKFGIGVRKDLSGDIKENLSHNKFMYSTVTDQLIYKPLFGKTAKQIKAEYGVNKLRDDLFTTKQLSDIARQEEFVDRLIIALKDYHKVKDIVVLNLS